MPYGIEIYNTSGNIQFSSQFCEQNFTVIDTGATSTGNKTVSYNPDNEILAVNLASTGMLQGNTNTSTTPYVWTDASALSVNWIKMRKMSVGGTAAEDSAGTYGIRCFTATGGLAWSSNFSKGQAVEDIIEPDSFQSSNPSSGLTFFATDHPVIYNGNPSGVYIAFGNMQYSATSSETIYHECFYFDHSTNQLIRGAGGYAFAAGRGTSFRPVPNTNTCIIFKRNG